MQWVWLNQNLPMYCRGYGSISWWGRYSVPMCFTSTILKLTWQIKYFQGFCCTFFSLTLLFIRLKVPLVHLRSSVDRQIYKASTKWQSCCTAILSSSVTTVQGLVESLYEVRQFVRRYGSPTVCASSAASDIDFYILFKEPGDQQSYPLPASFTTATSTLTSLHGFIAHQQRSWAQ